MRIGRSVLCFALLLMASVASAQAPAALDDATRRASIAVADALRMGDTKAVADRFDEAILGRMPRDQLATTLTNALQKLGALGPCDEPRGTRKANGLTAVEMRCDVGDETVAITSQRLQLAWNDAGRLTGLFFAPVATDAAPIALPTGSHEEAVVTGAPGWPLPGTLLVPAGPKSPIAVFVHGSGRNDRDETIGPNKPFRDLAIGLAEHGIATLRYDKRTFVHGARFVAELPSYTLDDEVVDDAVAALAMVAKDPRFGPVFVVGHSEGAWLAPRIASRAKAAGVPIAGIVMLAGNVTPLADLLVRQLEFLASLPSPTVTAAMVEDARRQRDDVHSLAASGRVEPGHEALPLGLPASIWLDIGRYDPAAALLADPSLPALLTFGERDYQVPASEKDLWSQRLGARPATTLVVMPGLDHLLMTTTGPMGPAAYRRPRRVATSLIDLVADWIELNRTPR
jgi:alpha-beta hydrolase superfamily lysophospholipase